MKPIRRAPKKDALLNLMAGRKRPAGTLLFAVLPDGKNPAMLLEPEVFAR